jgi:hypothetical protein
MKFLASNFPPLATSHKSYVDQWTNLFTGNDSLNIAVGYASNDSLLYLRKLVELNAPKNLNVCLGMARFEGLFNSQFAAATELSNYLQETETGNVYVSTQFPFHGKVQTFSSNKNITAGLIGSSNLSNIVPPVGMNRGNYEMDMLVEEGPAIKELDEFIARLLTDAAAPLDSITNLKLRNDPNRLMHSSFEVKPVDESVQTSVWESEIDQRFEIPIKTAPQSNLNAFFGEGRKNAQGFVKPRHWYEVEIIVGQEVQRSAENYPANKEFLVYTDDGYKFVLKTSGDYGKNLRSRDDLTVLGRWLKGRMENAGALASGTPVTEDVLKKYGRDTMTLTRTSKSEVDEISGAELEVFTMDFGANK